MLKEGASMNGRVIYDLHNMFLIGSLLNSILLMTFYISYIRVKTKPTYLINRYLTGQIMLVGWSVFLLFEWISPKASMATLFSYLKEGTMCSLGFFILYFLCNYYNRIPVIKRVLLMIATIPTLGLVFYIINELLGSHSKISDQIHVVAVTLNLIYFVFGLLYSIIKNLENRSFVRTKKLHFFITIIFFPIYAHLIYFFDILQLKRDMLIYLMPLYFMMIIAITIKYQLFDDLPFALEAVFENVHYGIIVVSNSLEILSSNKTFFGQYIPINEVGGFTHFIEELKQITPNKLSINNILTAVKEVDQNQVTGELKIEQGSKKLDFTYTINAIYDDYHEKIATMVTFRDITQITSLQYDIEEKNIQLVSANRKLKEHMENLRALTIEKERDALMTEINDTFGHSMTEILALLEVSSLLMEQELEERAEKTITDTIERARKALEEMRQSVSKYKKGATLDD